MTRQDKNKLALTNDDKTNKSTKGDAIDLFSGNKGQAQSASLAYAEKNPAKLNFY